MKLDALFRAAALLSILVAGSCSVANDGTTISEDGASNHPITVEPSYREMKVQFAGGEQGVSADDAVKFDAFLADYRAHGNGSLGIDRYIVLVRGKGSPDGNYLLDLKQALPASPLPRDPLPQPEWASEAERVVTVQRRMQAIAMAFLHPVRMNGQPYVLRALQPRIVNSSPNVAIASASH